MGFRNIPYGVQKHTVWGSGTCRMGLGNLLYGVRTASYIGSYLRERVGGRVGVRCDHVREHVHKLHASLLIRPYD